MKKSEDGFFFFSFSPPPLKQAHNFSKSCFSSLGTGFTEKKRKIKNYFFKNYAANAEKKAEFLAVSKVT